MLITVIGGASSGKSEIAEKLAAPENPGEESLYIATMLPYGEEVIKRIGRHRALRAAKGFKTAEKYRDIGAIETFGCRKVLLECVLNLTANEMFEKGALPEKAFEKVTGDIRGLCGKFERAVAVTGNVFEDGVTYLKETERYVGILAKINAFLAGVSDVVIESVAGIPVILKGGRFYEKYR